MHARTLALIIAAAVIGTGCASKESKPEPAATPTAASTPAPAATAVASKPECPPEPTAKKKTTAKTKTSKKAATPAVDCEPAKSKAGATTAKTAEPVAAAPAPAAKEAAKPAEAGKPRVVKSRDGTFEGEVYGNIPANSKWAKLQIGMDQGEVERILGTSHEVRAHPTAKAFIPFYFGSDSTRYEIVYRGQGSVSYTGGGIGGGRGVLMMINYDPNI
ncbi:hypothetical protein [Dechloromonas denitrificans]|uniref:hypothetical protein n=1 Tax=Dechloromonas denitrificans TaxID=281362 RepID=UPI001CF80761|nr:hypothetical protein [Dechloromonas denitrificans]UCV03161.1 hypothetical protein KI611_19155 [Dechloromonas denitrificans]